MNAHFLFEVFQFLVVTTLVVTASVYCLLTLSPHIIKQPLKQAMLRCPLPAFIKTKLQQTTAAGACGSNCGGCAPKSPAPTTTHTVKWHPRKG
jgi:hypothetical protein